MIDKCFKMAAVAVPILIGAFSAASPASAGQISEMVVFGDSLSDVGNNPVVAGSGYPPSYNGRYSDGPVWVEHLSNRLGLAPLAPSSQGGTDYAAGGATTGDMVNQAAAYINTGSVDPKALYVILGGSNDLENILLAALSSPNFDPATIPTLIAKAITNLGNVIGGLAAAGASDFLVGNVPDLGLTPDVAVYGPDAITEANLLTDVFDQGLTDLLTSLATTGSLDITSLDLKTLLNGVVASPSRYGFNDVTDPCGAASCSGYLFWDGTHPTTAAHAKIADAAAAELPEPGSIALVAFGLMFLAHIRRRAIRSCM